MISDTLRLRLANIERLAKDDSIPFDLLQKLLTRFIIDVKYTRTGYNIFVPLVFRARAKRFESHEEACTYFGHQEKISYPDIQKVTLGWGRCNGPDEAVFYCGDENVIPMFEVKPETGDYLILGQYRHQYEELVKLTIPVIGIEQIIASLKERDESNSLIGILAGDMHFKQSVTPEILSIDRHFAEWFTRTADTPYEHYYKLATALYQVFTKNVRIGNDNERFNGLMYPSVGSNITGVNLALETDFVDKNLKLLQATIYKVEKVDLETKYFCLQPLSDLSKIYGDGRLAWRQSAMIEQRLIFDPSTPTMHFDPPEDYLNAISVYE